MERREQPKDMGSAGGSDELGLLTRLRAGDEAAFLALVRQHQPALLRMATFRIGRRDMAEDAVQEAWAAFLKALPRFEGRSSLRTFLWGIAINCIRARVRSEARSVPMSALERDGDAADERAVPSERFLQEGHRWVGHWAAPPAAFPQLDAVAARELREVVRAAVGQLPAQQREVFVLRDIEGWETEEICNVLGLTDTHQRVLLHRARARIRAAIERSHGAPRAEA